MELVVIVFQHGAVDLRHELTEECESSRVSEIDFELERFLVAVFSRRA